MSQAGVQTASHRCRPFLRGEPIALGHPGKQNASNSVNGRRCAGYFGANVRVHRKVMNSAVRRAKTTWRCNVSTRMIRFMSLTPRNRRTTLGPMNKLCILPSFMVSLALLAIAPALRAQTAQGIEKAENVAQELKLTPQQEAKVLPILKQEAPKIQQIKNNPSMSGIQKMKELRAIHNETAPQLQQILSPEQYQKLQSIREQQIKQAMAKKRAGG